MIRRVPVLGGWLERRGRGRVRAIMRGYRRLKMKGQLGRIADAREALTNTTLPRVGKRASALLFGAGIANAELVVRQYLLIHVAHTTLNKALLHSLGRSGSPVVHPLPSEWRTVVQKQGFNVATMRSALVWNGYVALLFAYGVTSIGKRVFESLKAILRRPAPGCGKYVFFEGLSASNLPRPCADGRSHDIVTWYEQWPGRIREIDTLCHSARGVGQCQVNGIPVVALPSTIPPLSSPAALMRFVKWGIAATALAAVDVLRGRWWHALLLSQASSAAIVRTSSNNQLARDYLFPNSQWVFRPLWTYEAERAGSRITLYFYSTNVEPFKRPEGYPVQPNSWQAANWPLYLVWDEYQAGFVRRAVGEGANACVTGPIWLSSSGRDLPTIPTKAVAVFDVQPWRNSGYQFLGLADEYYTPVTVNRFLLDIHAATECCGGMMVLKRKRQVTHWLHPQYITLVERLGRSEHFLAVEPDLAPLRVIERCDAVVSLPFTSTALLGREMGKPSIYYDPHGVVQKDDRAAHGIPIVTGADELNAWMAAHLGRSATV